MTPQEMSAAARVIEQRWPDAVVCTDGIGNLNVDDDTQTGEYQFVAWVDCRRGTVFDALTGAELVGR